MNHKMISPGDAAKPAEEGVPAVIAPTVSPVPREETGDENIEPILEMGAREISVPLSAENIRSFTTYASLLRQWNQKMNLTSITDDKGIAMRHFVDSLTLVSHLEEELEKQNKEELSLIDVGTGAGFPGIPLRLTIPRLRITLLDSLKKRVEFLEQVCSELAVTDIQIINSRAEDAGHSKNHREQYDVATARAVAGLPVLLEYCMPFVKVGGIFLAMKGQVEEEINSARKATILLGGTIEAIHSFTLPGSEEERSIVVVRKLRNTPPRYPRKAGIAQKRPL